MASGDNDSTLPPLIDFGEDDNASSSSTGAQPFDYSYSSPLRDPFSAFEESSMGSSSSPFQQWETPSFAGESVSTPSLFDQTLVAGNAEDFASRSKSFSGNCSRSKSYTFGNNGSPYEVKDLLSDFSAPSVSCSQFDLLSSPDVASHLASEPKSSPGSSPLSQQRLPQDMLLAQALDSMGVHSPSSEMPASKGAQSPNYFGDTPNSSSSEAPSSKSPWTKEPCSHTVHRANDYEDEDITPVGQKTAKLQESHGTRVSSMKEFASAVGRKGLFKAPDRVEDGPTAFELRPQPLQEMSAQPTRVLACTDTALWLGCDQGIRIWDIPGAFRSSCDGRNNTKGDEDAAAYKYVHGMSPNCLFADTTNQLMWTGHKDGRIRAWHLSFGHGNESVGDGNTAIFCWQGHQNAVLAMVVSSYGDLWTGSDSGSLKVWPENVIAQAFSTLKESSTLATSYIDLRARGMSASSLATMDVRFLIAEHSQCRVWSGGSQLLALWDARTKDVLKLFGPNADAEYISPNVSPVREAGKGEETKLNAARSLKKEKNLATLNFFQRSRNAVMGAADAVLRAAVGVQGIDDSKKMEALTSAADGEVWAGYANGRLCHWDSSGNWLADFRHSSASVRCMYAHGNHMFVGYMDGVIHVLAISSGKLLRAWRAHKASVARMGVCGNHLYTLADNGAIRGWFTNSSTSLEKALHYGMISKECSYVRRENLKILAGTWNVGQERASFKSMSSWLEKGSIEASIVVVGLQEVEMGAGALAMAAAKETVGLAGSVNGQWWLDNVEIVLNVVKPFVRVGSRQLAGLLIGVWVIEGLLPYVGDVDVGAVACGFGRAFGNKGAVAVKMMVFRRTICVVNCHFAAHMEGVTKRNADFDHIYQRMAFGRSSGLGLAGTSLAAAQIMRNNNWLDSLSWEQPDPYVEKDYELADGGATMPELSDADLLVWVGDLNYRLADISYTEAVGLVYAHNWVELIKKDQLRTEMQAGRVFQGMREAYIMFQPTYKFDKGSTELGYDSSDKRRIPAWCDRVLYRDSFDSCEPEAVEKKTGLSRPVAVSANWYEACMATVESDHKPVSCLLNAQVAVINEAARRWEYGRFFRTNPEALTFLKQTDNVPEMVVHADTLVLINSTKATLQVSNESAKETAFFSIYSEGEPIGFTLQNRARKRKGGTCGLPFWLQVLPASGVIHPREVVELVVQYAGEDESGFRGMADLGHKRTVILVVNMRGLMSSASKQHKVKVCHSLSMASGDQCGGYGQRGVNYR